MTGPWKIHAERNELIRKMLEDGSTLQTVGTHLGLTRERVRQIANSIGAVRSRKRDAPKVRLAKLEMVVRPDKTASKTTISLSRLKELLEYDRQTGEWTWRINRGGRMKAGDRAGTLNPDGYVQIRVDYKLYMAHVLAWFYSFEQWPRNMIDHENRIRHDNRLNNLRQATYLQNFGNRPASKFNTSGFKNVWRRGDKWIAEVAHIKLGTFDSAEEAAVVAANAAKLRYGEFACLDLDNAESLT